MQDFLLSSVGAATIDDTKCEIYPTTGFSIVLFCGLIFTNHLLRDYCARRSRRYVSQLTQSGPLCSLNSMPSLAMLDLGINFQGTLALP